MSTKILTVDDNEIIRRIVATAFRAYDAVLLGAADGLTALSIAGREVPDVILLDYNMPGMNGSEVITKLRADPALKAIPVIMLTAENSRDTVTKIAKLGVRDYLLKPFKENILIERVNRVTPLKPLLGSVVVTRDAAVAAR